MYDAEGWPDAFDLTGVEVAVQGEELVVTAHFAGDVTQDSRVDLFLGDLTGFSWDGHSITIDWDYPSQGWAATIGTLPFTEGSRAVRGHGRGRPVRGTPVPLDRLPQAGARFQWFAFVSLAELLPRREPARDGEPPGDVPRLSPGDLEGPQRPAGPGGYHAPARCVAG